MARKTPPIPSSGSPAVNPMNGVYDPRFYGFLIELCRQNAEFRENITTLKSALNDVRAYPATVFPAIPDF